METDFTNLLPVTPAMPFPFLTLIPRFFASSARGPLVFSLTSDAQTRKGTVLLGAGSEMSNNEWTSLAITPKVGYFVQDGVAIGALINFQSDNVDKSTYELNNSVAEIGVFGRYYVSNNFSK